MPSPMELFSFAGRMCVSGVHHATRGRRRQHRHPGRRLDHGRARRGLRELLPRWDRRRGRRCGRVRRTGGACERSRDEDGRAGAECGCDDGSEPCSTRVEHTNPHGGIVLHTDEVGEVRSMVDDHRERRGGDGLAFVDLHNVLGINLHRGVCATLIHPHHPLVARCRADDALIPQSTHRSPRTEEPVCSRGKVPSPPCKIRHGGEILTPHHEHTPRMELGCRPLVGRSRPASRSSFDES